MICNYCNQEMMNENTISCVENVKVDVGDGLYNPIKFGSEERYKFYKNENERCHDCKVKINGIHHPGCDVEECPQCHRQLISCGCLED